MRKILRRIIKMKIKKRATVYTDVYIANDGKEFTSKDDCMRHEEAVRELCAKSDNVIEAVRALNLRSYGLGADDLWTYRWFFIKNERGLEEFIAMIGDCGYDNEEQHKWIGQWICAECECDDFGDTWIYTLAETEKEHKMLLDILDDAQHETETVTELCPECDREVTLVWNPRKQGFKAFCPHCGARLMLCDECQHRTGGGCTEDCDYDLNTDTCRFNRPETK